MKLWTISNARLWWKTGAAIGGVVAAGLALYLFYLHPLLGMTSGLDAWLEQHRCLLESLCSPRSPLVNPLGTASVLIALLCFGLAGFGESLAVEEAATATAWRWIGILLCGVLSAGAVAFQVYQSLVRQEPPAVLAWLLGIGGLLGLCLLWDAAQPQLLQRTLANLALGLGGAVVILGAAGLLARPPLWSLSAGFLAGGALLCAAGGFWTRRLQSSFQLVDHGWMWFCALVFLGLAMSQAWSWRYAFIGDEWAFYELAQALNHPTETLPWFAIRGYNGYFAVFSAQLQAWSMQLFGETVFGWRLSSVLPAVYAIPCTYITARWLAGRRAAFLSAGLLAGSHMLLGFSMVAYNNTQALLPITAGLAGFVFAERTTSKLRYAVLGLAVGMGFVVYGLARLAVLPIALLLVLHTWTSVRRAVISSGLTAAGGVVAAAPLLFNLENWRSLLRATPVQSEVASQGVAVGEQVGRNLVAGLLTFITNPTNTHFVIGPYIDPLTLLLLLVGLAYLLFNSWRQRRWLSGLGVCLLLVALPSAIQQYDRISTTRMFILPIVYALLAGVGGAVLVGRWLTKQPRGQLMLATAFVVASIGLNQIHLRRVSWPRLEQPPETLLIQQLQTTAAANGGGMPVFVIWSEPKTDRIGLIVRGYAIAQERVIFLTAAEALSLPHLCQQTERAAMLLVDVRVAQLDHVRQTVTDCWPGVTESKVRNQNQQTVLIRFLNAPGEQELARSPQQRQSQRPQPAMISLAAPRDLVVDGSGRVFALAARRHEVWSWSAGARRATHFTLQQTDPRAIALTPEGYLIVSAPDPKLIWYDGAGQPLRSLPPATEVGILQDLAVTSAGVIFGAAVDRGRVVQLSANGEIIKELTAGGQFIQPSSLGLLPSEKALWVHDPAVGKLFLVDIATDEVLSVLSGPFGVVEEAPQLLVATNGDLLWSSPNEQRVVRVNAQGEVQQIWSGFLRPQALAVDGRGQLYVGEERLDAVGILPALTDAPTAIKSVAKTASPAEQARWQSPLVQPASPLAMSAAPSDDNLAASTLANAASAYLPGATLGGLQRPVGIAVAPNGDIFVADIGMRQVVHLSPDGELRNRITAGEDTLQEPTDLAIGPSGLIYLLDAGRASVYVFAATGDYLRFIPAPREFFAQSRGLTVDAEEQVWIANTSMGQIVALDAEGGVLQQFPVLQAQQGQPVDVALAPDGSVFVTEANTGKLVHYSRVGELLGQWPLPGFNTVDGSHLAATITGRLFLTKPEQNRVLEFNSAGDPMREWQLLRPDGSLVKPIGVAVGEAGDVWTVDSDRGAVVHFPAE